MEKILKKSKLCWGPMSKNIVDSLIKYANNTDTFITIIPSRRQIEWDGGYVNNWKTEDFCKYVKENTDKIALQRDHAGPGQGYNDDDGYKSLEYDCKYFDAIHLDPWKKYPKLEDGIKWTIDMINFCYDKNNKLYFEVGTEEAIRPFTSEEINMMLQILKSELSEEVFNRIIFCVIQSGTALQDGLNIGKYNNIRLKEMINVVKKYELLSKEHNGDYMKKEIMEDRFNNNLDSLNIAPEIGVFETKKILELLNEEDFNKMYKICLDSKKWVKWVSKDFKPEENKKKLVEICGHYVFSYPKFLELKIKINSVDEIIKDTLYIYLTNKYNLK
jgi:hypothetical protein